MRRFMMTAALFLVVLGGPLAAEPVALGPARVLDLGVHNVRMTTTDLDGDGILDIVRTDEDGLGLTCLVNEGDATFQALPEILAGYRSFQPAAAGDLDGDGDQDLVVGLVHYVGDTHQIDENALVVLLNDGSGYLSTITVADDCHAWTQWSVVDLDGDGDLDIAYGCLPVGGAQEMGLLVNDGAGHFTAGSSIAPSLAEGDTIDYMAAFGDLGTDGLPELFVQLTVSGPTLLVNEGSLTFSAPVAVGPGQGTGEALFADVTGDGHTDIVSGREGIVGVWVGDGEDGLVSFEWHGTGSGDRPSGYLPTCIADFDDDGDLDAAVASWAGNVGILTNPGDGRLETNHEYHLGPGQLQTPFVRWCAFGTFDESKGDELFVHAVGYQPNTFLFSPGPERPPTILSFEPTRLESGRTHEVTVTGTGITEDTTLHFQTMWEGDPVRVIDRRVESSERLTATVEIDHWDIDEPREPPSDGPADRLFHVILFGRDGGSSRIPDGLAVPPYWSGRLERVEGRLKDVAKPGRDRFKARGSLLIESLLPLLAQAGREGRLVIGSKGATTEWSIPADDPGWKISTKGGAVRRAIWKSPRKTKPKVKIELRNDSKNWEWKVSVKKLDFPAPQEREIRIELHLGDERFASIEKWREDGPGVLSR